MNKANKIVGVRFEENGKIYYFNSNNLDLNIKDKVIVEISKGIEFGIVLSIKDYLDEKKINSPSKSILRIATKKDEDQIDINKKKEEYAFKICIKNIKKYNLEMKLLKVNYTFDCKKVIFYFFSENRIDFRDLIKELASSLKIRIELKQIGVRDEAKIIKGYGCCGRKLCCCSFLSDFDTVFIKMAKNQNLSLNPTKISGVCGRLMCCLKYEDETYKQLKAEFPREGDIIETDKGKGKIIKNHLFSNEVTIAFEDGGFSKFSLEEINFKSSGLEVNISDNRCCKKRGNFK